MGSYCMNLGNRARLKADFHMFKALEKYFINYWTLPIIAETLPNNT